MKVVLAEKPSVAKELAKVLGASNKKDGFIEGNGYIFTWAFGHLVQLASPQEYGYNLNGWDVGCLPMIPTNFKLVPRQLKGKDGYYDDPGVTKQLKIIRGCFEKADEIIVATDAGREGELIFRYIY
jgi:DNA topoisomerase-3